MNNKTIIILGGGYNQISMFLVAKNLGYRTILCDAKRDVVCQQYADEYFQIDISKAEEIIKVVEQTGADGVISNTESLMMCLSEVQSATGLMGNSAEAVEKLINKYSFRSELKKAGLFSPETYRVSTYSEAEEYLNSHNFPLIVKPEKSSGSRGTYIVRKKDDFNEMAFEDSIKYSRSSKVLIEDFVDMSGKTAVEAEMFVYDGKIEHLCCFRTLRDKKYRTIPQCYCSDTELDGKILQKIYDELALLVKQIGITWGEYNVELSFNENNEIFIIEINARQGGMRLPEFVRIYTGIDMNKLLVSTAVNDTSYLEELRRNKPVSDKNIIHFRLLCEDEGIYKGLVIEPELEQYLTESFFYYLEGEKITPTKHSMASVGVLDFKFNDSETRKKYEERLFEAIKIVVE